jgi:serine/threonine-protein kinase
VTEDGAPFLVMEFLEGETLSAIARRTNSPLELAAVLRLADQVLDVLAAAHAQGIIHRDIKPDNLLMLKDGRVKVLDFGIARLRDSVNARFKTSTGTTLGTVSYMPPEQAKGIDIDARADIYAVGATAFRLLAGRRVHEADTEVERLMKVVSDPAPPLASVAPGVPGDACAVIDKALAFDRENRYPDAGSMQADVRAILRGEPPTHVNGAGGSPSRRAEPSKREAVTAALLPAQAVEVPTVGEGPARPGPASTKEAPTRAVPGYAQDLATVAAPGPLFAPATVVSTAATRPEARVPVVSSAPPVGARATSRQEMLAAIAVGSLLLVLLLGAGVWLLASSRAAPAQGDSPASADSSVPNASVPSTMPGSVQTTTVTAPPPVPGHGRGHHK